jgi:F-type H+-transporting ATPase subunit b
MEFAIDAEFWAIIALFLFIGVVLYLRVPKLVNTTLDARIAKIEAELAEASRLREEARALLAGYANKRAEAEAEAQQIITAARDEAARLAAEAGTALEALIVRRTKAVEDKIAQAETQAVAEVRGRSADLAIEAARLLLTQQMATKGDGLVTQAIQDVAAKLN